MQTTIETTSSLIKTFAVFSGRERTIITIQLGDECRNGHEDFSLTADIDEKAENGRWVEAGGGCCHEHILKLRPELKPFADLHLCTFEGIPTHAMANGFYWFAGFNDCLEEYHGGSGSYGKNKEECRRIFCEHFRISAEECDSIVAQSPRTQAELQAIIEDMSLPARWKQEADAAIAKLEEWTGKKFVSQATRKTFEPLTAEFRQVIAERKASGYYSPEQVAKRDAEKREAQKQALIQSLIDDCEKGKAKLDRELSVQLCLARTFGAKVNAIYYTHSNTLTFNWSTLEKLMTREEFNRFVAGVDLSKLPQDIKFEFQEKPRH